MTYKTDVTVIGAGASGMTAAIRAASKQRKVILVEKQVNPGRKILASGNGRCNLLNLGKPRYYGDSDFAESVLKQCPADDIISFFKYYGLAVTTEDEDRMYPYSFQAASVLNVLKNAIYLNGVSMMTGFNALSVQKEKDSFLITGENGDTIQTAKVIIACGGAAQPKLGGTYDGYQILHSLGHTIIPTYPALVSLTTDPKSISGLSGIRSHCEITLVNDRKVLHQEKGEILFTDYGISGICVMQCARFTEKEKTQLQINFVSGIYENTEDVTEELRRRQKMLSDLSPVSLFDGILPERISFAVLKQAGIPLHGETAGSLLDNELRSIADRVMCYKVIITGTRGMDFAQVTAGGADCGEFISETMESRIISGVHAAGEVLNVDGDCGGFNLMFAFSSGIIAGRSV